MLILCTRWTSLSRRPGQPAPCPPTPLPQSQAPGSFERLPGSFKRTPGALKRTPVQIDVPGNPRRSRGVPGSIFSLKPKKTGSNIFSPTAFR